MQKLNEKIFGNQEKVRRERHFKKFHVLPQKKNEKA